MDIIDLWFKLSTEARRLGAKLGRIYDKNGTFRFALNDLTNLGSLRAILFIMYELESREFGVVSGGADNTQFVLNRAKFDTLLSAEAI